MAAIEDLLLKIDASTEGLRRELKRADKQVAQSTGKIDRDLKKIDRRFALLGTSAKSSMAGLKASLVGLLAAGLALRRGLRAAEEAINFADTIAKTADAVGVSTDSLQEFRFAADLAGVSTDALDKALKFLTRSVGELRTRVSSELSTALKDFDRDLLNNIKNAKNQEEVFKLVVRALEKETDATKRAALSKAAFGRAGIDLVNIANAEAGAFDRARQEARDLGTVIGEDLIRQTVDSKDELTRLQKQIDADLTVSLLRLQGTLIALKGTFRDAVEVFVDFNDLIIDGATAWQQFFAAFGLADAAVLSLRQIRDIISDTNEEITELDAAIAGLGPIDDSDSLARTFMRNKLFKERIDLVRRLAVATARESFLVGPPPGRDPNAPAAPAAGGGGGPVLTAGGRGPEITALDAFMLKLREETALLRLSVDVRAQEVAVRRAQALAMAEGNLLTEAQIANIRAEVAARQDLKTETQATTKAVRDQKAARQEAKFLIASLATEEERLIAFEARLNELVAAGALTRAKANQVLARTKERMAGVTLETRALERGLDLVDQAIRGNMDTWQDWARVAITELRRVIDEILRNRDIFSFNPVMTGGGGGSFLGSIFSLFGGGGGPGPLPNPLGFAESFAHGGRLRAGQLAVVGEAGPEIFRPDSAGIIIPNSALGGGAAGRGSTTVTNQFFVDNRGASVEAVVRLERIVRQVNGSIERRAVSAVVQARFRQPRLFGRV